MTGLSALGMSAVAARSVAQSLETFGQGAAPPPAAAMRQMKGTAAHSLSKDEASLPQPQRRQRDRGNVGDERERDQIDHDERQDAAIELAERDAEQHMGSE